MARLPREKTASPEHEPSTVSPEGRPHVRATISDVARMADVSPSTASRVLRGEPAVSTRARTRVMAAAEAVGYRANPLAQTLRRNGNLPLVALIVPDVTDPYFNDIYMTLQRACLDRGVSLVLACHEENPSVQHSFLEQVGTYRPSAIVLVPTPGTTNEDIAALQAQGIHVISLDRPVGGATCDAIVSANEEGARLLADVFIERGCRRVGITMLPRKIWTQERRYEALLAAFEKHRIRIAMVVEEPTRSAPSGTAFAQLMQNHPDGIIALSVPPAMGVIRQEMEHPGGPIVLGCFDRHPWFDLVRPEIVTVSQDADAVVAEVSMLLDQEGAGSATGRTTVLPFTLDNTKPPHRYKEQRGSS